MEEQEKKALSQWLMDVAKYVATAVLVSSLFGDFERKWVLYGVGLLLVSSFLFFGIRILKTKK